MDNLTNTFSSVNDQVGQIATEVGKTPSNFMPAVFNMIRNLSESVIMPVAGILLTFIACYELIQLIISYNNLASFETWFIWKWIFKTFVAVELITHTFDITMAVFDVSQSVVRQAGGIIQGSTAVDASTLATMQSTLEAMELGPLLAIFLQSFIVQFLMYVLSAVIFVIINGRMVEIYLMVSLAPLPCNLWKQGTEHDGPELYEKSVCTGISGIFDHGMCGNLCSPDPVSSIQHRYHCFVMEGYGLYDPVGIYLI